MLPDLKRTRLGEKRFRGLRLIHTHLKAEPLSREDLTDLGLLRLDLIASIDVLENGLPGNIRCAHLIPENSNTPAWNFLDPVPPSRLEINFLETIESLEEEFARKSNSRKAGDKRERAILVSIIRSNLYDAEESLEELKELARTSGVLVVDSIIQKVEKINPKFFMGRGKLNELIMRCMQHEADLLIFDQNLSPAQVRSISDYADVKVIDRTQLILDIFAQRAHSRDGKIQVELAQLKYMLPRLVGKGIEMSQLMGGIGGKGPGETKLEIDRRKAKERINYLEKQIKHLSKERFHRRSLRKKRGLPIISIIGYTNAGKSTLLNNLTNSQVFVEDKLFATLDPSSRRLRFPKEREVIITDTVGFIRDLPEDLINAFKATLEELEDADLLLHLVDISSPYFEKHIKAVEKILEELKLDKATRMLVFNKADKIPPEQAINICKIYNAISISAINPETLFRLLKKIEEVLWGKNSNLFPLENTSHGILESYSATNLGKNNK